MARSVDHVLALFPFEERLYRDAGVSATYVGHPLADVIPPGDWTHWGREQLKIQTEGRIFALLPGSRQSELHYHADLFVRVAKRIAVRVPGARFLVPLVSRETRRQFEAALYDAQAQDLAITMLFGHAREAIAAADAVLAGSAQALEHYEIARYGTLKTWAIQLGHQDAAKLLDETLQEEKKTDQLLTSLAERLNIEGIDGDASGSGKGSSGKSASGKAA